MADSSIGANNNDAQLQQLLINSQQQQQQSVNDVVNDGESEAARKAAEKRLFLKQQNIKISTQTSMDERVSLHENQAIYNEAYSGRLGPDVQQLMVNPQMQQKLTSAQKRMFFESLQQDAPKAQQAAAAFNRLSTAPAFAQAVPTAQGVGEVFSMVMQNPRLEGSIQKALQSDFMQSPRADVTTKSAFLRFGTQSTAKDPMRSIQAAGDMLGSLSKTRTPVSAQRSAMAMVQRDPNNVDGMKNVDAFVQVPTIRTMPSMARGFATTTLSKADGSSTVREGLEAVSQNSAFSGLSGKNKAQVFATINLGRTSDLRAVTDQMLRTFETPGFSNLRQGQLTVLFQQMGQQVRGNKVSSEGGTQQQPAALVRQAKKSGMPVPPSLINMASIDPEDEETLVQARAQNRSKIIQYYNQVSGNYEEVEGQLGRAKYIEDLHQSKGLRQSEAPDLKGLDVSKEFSDQIDSHLENLKQKSDSRQISRSDYTEQLKNFSQTIAQQMGRPLTTDESTYVFAQQKQAQADFSFGDLTRQKGQRMRELRGQRMPPKKRRQQAADQRPASQARYFSPNAGNQRQAFSLPLPGQGQNQLSVQGKNSFPQQQNGTTFTQRSAGQGMPGTQNSMPQMPRPMGQVLQNGRSSGMQRGTTQANVLRSGGFSGDIGGVGVEEEVAQIVGKLDPNLPAAKKIEQAKQMLLQRHVALATQVMEALTQDVGELSGLQSQPTQRKASRQGAQPADVAQASGGSGTQESLEATTPSAIFADVGSVDNVPTRGRGQNVQSQGLENDKTSPSQTMPKSLDPVEAIGQKARGSAQGLVDKALQAQDASIGHMSTETQKSNAGVPTVGAQNVAPTVPNAQTYAGASQQEQTDVQNVQANFIQAPEHRMGAQSMQAVEKVGEQRPRGAAAALADRVMQQSGVQGQDVLAGNPVASEMQASNAGVPTAGTQNVVSAEPQTQAYAGTSQQEQTDVQNVQANFIQAPEHRMGAQSMQAVAKVGEQRPRGAAAALANRVMQQSGFNEQTTPSFATQGAQVSQGSETNAAGYVANMPTAAETTTRTIQGKTDAWGIQRTFERDLGATGGAQQARSNGMSSMQAVGSDFSTDTGMGSEPLEKYTGRALVKNNAQIRDVGTLYNVAWKQMSRAEVALMRNLGWTQQMWDTKFEASARWPTSMRTSYERLSPKQRESVRLLGLSSGDWDAYVEGNEASGSMDNQNGKKR